MTTRRKPERGGRPYLGYRGSDRDTPFAKYFDPQVAPLAPHVVEAVNVGPLPAPLLTGLDEVGAMVTADDEPTENGYAIDRDGSLRVAVRIEMPDITPGMWDWWFGWHGDDTRKYKLWHPRAHLFAQWADDGPARGPRSYVGRTSFVDEYLGSTLARAAIRFVPPAELGVDEAALEAAGATMICARVGLSGQPADAGWLAHHVRPSDGGAEMRSRFWIGGRHAAPRSDKAALVKALTPVVSRAARLSPQDAVNLLVHCAQEMGHLAAFLPALHAELAGDDRSQRSPRPHRRTIPPVDRAEPAQAGDEQ